NSGGSGLLLSGLYGKNIELLALAIAEGQAIGSGGLAKPQRGPLRPEDIDRAIEFGGILWRARFGNSPFFSRLVPSLKVNLAFALYGEQLEPIYDALTAYLPVDRPARPSTAWRDWDYLTAFLHHKLLLVDERRLILGGRNVEDPYHMAPSSLVERYLFRDTDVEVELREGERALTR